MSDNDQILAPEGAGVVPADTSSLTDKDALIDARLKRLSNNVAFVAALIGTFVTIGTSLTSCSRDNIERYRVFRDAVSTEERYWKDLYEKYLAVTDRGDVSDPQTKRQIAAIRALANHQVPTFEEHQLGIFYLSNVPQKQASESIAAMKRGLDDALKAPEIVGNEQAQKSRAAGFAVEERDAVRARKGEDVTIEQQKIAEQQENAQSVTSGSSIAYNSVVISAGEKNGTDIDIFWCGGGNEQASYNAGNAVAVAIANSSDGSGADALLGRLGRIRLRLLPESIQQKPGYPSSGNQVRGDQTETDQVKRLVAWLNRGDPKSGYGLEDKFEAKTVAMRTPYYLSVFVCSVDE